ncbi:MAG: hypothetical protein RIQ71_596 [Verrucomicrobiota bacterium]|jgi:hypothetical protein
MPLNESIVEGAALEWFAELGCAVGRGSALVALRQPKSQMPSMHVGRMAEGGAYPDTPPEIIGAMQVALPNDSKIFEAFYRHCAPLFEQLEANRTQSRTLATLRDTLLPKLLSGELSVAEMEKAVPA